MVLPAMSSQASEQLAFGRLGLGEFADVGDRARVEEGDVFWTDSYRLAIRELDLDFLAHFEDTGGIAFVQYEAVIADGTLGAHVEAFLLRPGRKVHQ